MRSWYHAVCDQHKEVCDIFTYSWNTEKIEAPLGEGAPEAAKEFLEGHYACELRLLRDDVGSWPKDYVNRSPP